LSFHPVSPEGTVEVTTSFKYFRKRLHQGVREHTDRNMSEHRKSLEKGNAFADLVEIQRRLRSHRKQNDKGTGRECRGSGDGMYVQETRRNTGNPPSQDKKFQTGNPRGTGWAKVGGGQARSSREATNPRRAKGPEFKHSDQRRDRQGIGKRLSTPNTVWELQQSLHVKAKEHPTFRFYSLYDKLYRRDFLTHAWGICRRNGGAPGTDGESFEAIEERGVDPWLDELAQALREKTYSPGAVRRVYIPKPNGKRRPLGIPTIKDRVVQTAALLLLEPIFEVDLQPEQYAYRRDRNAHDAIRHTHQLLGRGHREVIDADLSGYFDTIPHPELMRCLARRISDGALLKLLKSWLEMPIEEDDDKTGKRRSNPGRRAKRGTPQGAPISPLLSNLYMRRFLLGWKQRGYDRKLKAHIVNYADDFVILCRDSAEIAERLMRAMMRRLKLTINEDKTKVKHLPRDSVDFLGYTLGTCYSTKTGRSYIGIYPSKKKVQQFTGHLSELTRRNSLWKSESELVAQLNRRLRGWGNYFCLGPVSKAYRAVDSHVRDRLRQWLRSKHKVQGAGTRKYPDEYLYQELGLVRLETNTRNLPWAKT
jgi:RNA-directed DNA polymerase